MIVFSYLQGFKIFFFVASALYVAYLLVLMTKAYSELRAMPFFGRLIHI